MSAQEDKVAGRVQLDTVGVGERLGISAVSVRRYMVADRDKYSFPQPDGYLGRTPWWWSDTIDEWAAARPGRGVGGGRPRKPTHVVEIERRNGVRGPHPAESFRWACGCGDVGRWTRQHDTARKGAERHAEKAGA